MPEAPHTPHMAEAAHDPLDRLDPERLDKLMHMAEQPGVYFGRGIDLDDHDREQFGIIVDEAEAELAPLYEDPEWQSFADLVDEGASKGVLSPFGPFHKDSLVPVWCVDGGEDAQVRKIKRQVEGDMAAGIEVPTKVFDLYNQGRAIATLRNYVARPNDLIKGTSPKPLARSLQALAPVLGGSEVSEDEPAEDAAADAAAEVLAAEPTPEAELRPSYTFEQIAQASKSFSDKFIANYLNDDLYTAPGEKALMIKAYLDNVPADSSDKEFCKDPEAMGEFHDQLTDFIGEKLRIVLADDDPAMKKQLRPVRRAFLQKLEADKQLVRDLYRDWAAWDRNPRTRPDSQLSAREFYGLNVDTPTGKEDLLDLGTKVEGVRANIRIQREVAGTFVHWHSDSFALQKVMGQAPEVSRRIYLNPRSEDAVRIFDEIVTAANEHGLNVAGKIYDKGSEGLSQIKRPETEFGLRADTIVLYAGEDADALLAIVEGVHGAQYDSFAGRRTPRIPYRLGDGIAVGDEPPTGESLTASRAALLGDALVQTKQQLGLHSYEEIPAGKMDQAVQLFRQVCNDLAEDRRISDVNIAFNEAA